jgi:hypothetical protein
MYLTIIAGFYCIFKNDNNCKEKIIIVSLIIIIISLILYKYKYKFIENYTNTNTNINTNINRNTNNEFNISQSDILQLINIVKSSQNNDNISSYMNSCM